MLEMLLRFVLLLLLMFGVLLMGGVVMVTVVVPLPLGVIDSLCSDCAFLRRLYGVKRRTGPDAAEKRKKIQVL